jgi:nickel-dependent lactate racemase
MKKVEIPYGKSHLTIPFEDHFEYELILPNDIVEVKDPLGEVCKAIEEPIDGKRIEDYFSSRKIKTVAIAINDNTRPVPHQFLLPPLLECLRQLNIKNTNIRILIATGTHKPMLSKEFAKILPMDIIEQYSIISHDCDSNNLINCGISSKGTIVLINRLYFECDFRIVVGNIEPHHFMGFSGGVKSAAIGLTGRDTITQNHSMLSHLKADIAIFEDNPMREDVEEIGKIIRIDYAVNTVLNRNKDIIQVYAGSPLEVMKAAIPKSIEVCQTIVKGKYDLVIASAGGHPKDLNLYQSQKAITHACQIVRDRGVIILVAACPEGTGNVEFENFLNGVTNIEQAILKFNLTGFKVGPHKAFQIARQSARVHIILVSEMSSELVSRLLIKPADDIQSALKSAFEILPPKPRIAIMPFATNTLSTSA